MRTGPRVSRLLRQGPLEKGRDAVLDKTNQTILALLRENSRLSWQAIGRQVHLTGQAVAARVQQLEDEGLITGYTIRQDHLVRHFITVFMETPTFDAFETFLKQQPCVEAAYKVAGEGCYQVVLASYSQADLEPFLNALLKYGKYRVSSVIRQIK